MKLRFKFKGRTTQAARDAILDTVRALGAREVRRLFPDASDAELATLYTVELGDAADPAPVLAELKRAEAVEFAEPDVRRKMIR